MAQPARSRRASIRTHVLDLHGYDVVTALELATARVADAYRNGYTQIELVHGAANVTEPAAEGRGRIKWALRRMAAEGGFDAYCRPGETWPRAGSLVLALRANPSPRPESWTPAPPRAYR